MIWLSQLKTFRIYTSWQEDINAVMVEQRDHEKECLLFLNWESRIESLSTFPNEHSEAKTAFLHQRFFWDCQKSFIFLFLISCLI